MHVLKKLLGFVGSYKRDAWLAPLFVACEVILDVLIPLVISIIIDQGITPGNFDVVYRWGAIMAVMAGLSLVVGVMAGRCASHAATGFGANLRLAMFQSVQRYSFSNIDKFSTPSLVTRMTVDVTNIQNAFMMLIRAAVRAPMNLIASLIMCLVISARLSVIFFVAMLVIIVVMVLVIGPMTKLFRQVFTKYDELNASIQENISGIRVVKAFVREDYEKSKFYKAVNNLYKLFVRAEGLMAFVAPLMILIVYACTIALSWFGAQLVVSGGLLTGELTALFTYVMTILMSLMMLSMLAAMIMMSLASAQRVVEVIEEQPDIADPQDPLFEVPDGSIDFEQVSFTYKRPQPAKPPQPRSRLMRKMMARKSEGDGGPATEAPGPEAAAPGAPVDDRTLRDIDLHIKSGETVGIVGGTGSGKSTLVSLVSRLYDADAGTVRVGGHDVRAYDTSALCDQVAVVLQQNELFSGTVLDNLRWGDENATEEECREACRIACADEFIERLPQGYQTVIEQGGTNVSGGQKQRLCIARALLKHPKVLILDDSTSAVDTATDARIRQALAGQMADVTKLIIAQRVSSVEDADRILVLDQGAVAGFDTPQALMETNDIYRQIYETQAKAGGDFDAPRPDEDLLPLAAGEKGGER